MKRASGRGSVALTVAGLVAFISVAAAYPVLYATKGPRVSTTDKALNGDATIRGAYVNAGSRDIGLDPSAGNYKPRSAQ